jgi:hypothetical protein
VTFEELFAEEPDFGTCICDERLCCLGLVSGFVFPLNVVESRSKVTLGSPLKKKKKKKKKKQKNQTKHN